MGGGSYGHGGKGLEIGGDGFKIEAGGPPSGDPSQLPPRRDLLNGPSGGPLGGGDVLGGNRATGPQVPLQMGAPLLTVNGSLKGTTLVIFNGNQKNTKQFTQEFTLYHMINQDAPTIRTIPPSPSHS